MQQRHHSFHMVEQRRFAVGQKRNGDAEQILVNTAVCFCYRIHDSSPSLFPRFLADLRKPHERTKRSCGFFLHYNVA